MGIFEFPIANQIHDSCNTSDNGKSRFTEDVSHVMELRQNRQIAKRSAKNLREFSIDP